MKSNFYNQGTNIIAHHFFNGKKDLSGVRYMSVGLNTSSVDMSSFTREMKEGGGYTRTKRNENTQSQTPNKGQSATDKQTYVIRSLGELEGPLREGQSGQMLDLRDHRVSPEVYAALSRGEAVEVQLQQMAPERVNLFTPMIASAMQIFGGMAGGVDYNEALSSVITGNRTNGDGSDTGQLGKAAAFVNKHGTAYDLGLGTGEHIDVVAHFRVLNEEGKKTEGPVVKPPAYTPPKPKKDVGTEDISKPSHFERPEDGVKPKTAKVEPQPVVKVPDGKLDVETENPNLRVSYVDNGTPLVAIKPRMMDYRYKDKDGNGKSEDENTHSFLESKYKGSYGSSGKVNTLTSAHKKDGEGAELAESSSTIRGVSPNSSVKDGSGANWYQNAIKNGTYPVQAAKDFLSLASSANLISKEELAAAGNDPKKLGELFSKVETQLGDSYHLRESGNLGSAHIRALENALIDRVQALNGAVTFTAITASQGQQGLDKLNKYQDVMSGNTKLPGDVSVPDEMAKIEKIVDPTARQAAREALTNKISTWLKGNGFSDQEAVALRDLSPKDISAIKTQLSNRNISLEKIASGDMTGVSSAVKGIESQLESISDNIKSAGYDDSRLPQFKQLKSQIDTITGGKDGNSGSIDSLKNFIDFKSSGKGSTSESLVKGLENVNSSGKVLPEPEMEKAKNALAKVGNEAVDQLKALGMSADYIHTLMTDGKLDPQKVKTALADSTSELSVKTNANPAAKANLQNFVKAGDLITQQSNIASTEKQVKSLQERANKGESIPSSELEGLKNHGNPTLSAAIDKLKSTNERRNDISEINSLSNKLTTSPDKLTDGEIARLGELKSKYSSDKELVSVIDSIVAANTNSVSHSTGKVADEYNTMIGGREYLEPFAQEIASAKVNGKDIDLSSLKNSDGTFNHKKVLDFINDISSMSKPPTEQEIANLKPESKKIMQDLVASDKKDSIGDLTKKAGEIKEKVKNSGLDRTQDQEAVELINSYGLKKGDSLADIRTDDKNPLILDKASSVKINTANLGNTKVMNMVQDYFKLAVQAGIMTQQEVDAAGKDPGKVNALFNKLENTLHDKYGLKKDQLFGAEHINDIQEALYDKAGVVSKGVIALDKLYEGKTLTTDQNKQLQALVDEYNKSGKGPITIAQLKDSKIAGELLKFSEEKLTNIKNSLSPQSSTNPNGTNFGKNGQLDELMKDIDRVIGKSGGNSGIIPLREAIESDPAALDQTGTAEETQASTDFQTSLKQNLTSLRDALKNGQTSVRVDKGNGKYESVNAADYAKQLENDYKNFLLTSNPKDIKDVAEIADLLSNVHYRAKLSPTEDSAYNEVAGSIALLAQAKDIEVDNFLVGKPGHSTINTSDDLTNKMIDSINVNKLEERLRNCFSKTNPKEMAEDLGSILGAKFSNFSDQQIKELFAIAERIMKKAGIQNAPNLTDMFEQARKAGRSTEEAMKEVVAAAKLPKPEMGSLVEDSFDGKDTTENAAPAPKKVEPTKEQAPSTSTTSQIPTTQTPANGTQASASNPKNPIQQVAYNNDSTFLDGGGVRDAVFRPDPASSQPRTMMA